MTKYIVKSLYCFHLCSVLHQCHLLLKFHCKTEFSTSLTLLSIWAFSQEQCSLFSRMSCEMRKLPYIHFTNRGLRHRDINVNRANSLLKFIVWLSKGTRHFIALHFSSAMQSFLVSIGNSKHSSFHFNKSDWRVQIRNPEIEEHTGITCEKCQWSDVI